MAATDAAILLILLLAIALLVALAWYTVWKVPPREEPRDGVGPSQEGAPIFRVKSIAKAAPPLLIRPAQVTPDAPPRGTAPVLKKTVKVNPLAPCRVTGKPKTHCRHCQENEAHDDDL